MCGCGFQSLQRFRPITMESPKALVPLVNVPMIDYALEWLASAGVEEVRNREERNRRHGWTHPRNRHGLSERERESEGESGALSGRPVCGVWEYRFQGLLGLSSSKDPDESTRGGGAPFCGESLEGSIARNTCS